MSLSIHDAYAQLSAANADLVALHPIEQYAKQWVAAQRRRSYSFVGPTIRSAAAAIVSRAGPEALGRYHKVLIAYLAQRFDADVARHGLPDSVETLLRSELARIVADLARQEHAFYAFENDLFLKDMGLCTFRLLPCGAELVQVDAGVPRRLLVRGGAVQLLLGLYLFVVRLRGFFPMYALHMDPRNTTEFTPEGWNRTYLRIAELMHRHPEVKGVFGTAWFYDPALETISPRLAYVRKERERNGAWNFRYGPSAEAAAGALAKSAHRRRLNAAGKYVPASYYLVWPREALLQWAAAHRRDIASAAC